jgi:hypothetical protein
VATIVYLTSIVLTLVFALTIPNQFLILGCICVQLLALFWYGLSFIPYGRKMAKGMVTSAVSV